MTDWLPGASRQQGGIKMTNWLKRSGIKKDEREVSKREDEAGASEGESATPEVKNDKATPIIGEERGIPSVNHRSFRSRALPLSFAAVALAATAIVWLIPSPQTPVQRAKDDPRATKDQRFDENKSSAVLAPTAPPLPPEPPKQISLAPSHPTPLATPKAPIQIVPAPDPRAAPTGGRAPASQRSLTPLELRQQSKVLIVGAADKGETATTGNAPMALANNPGFAHVSATPANILGEAGGSSGNGGPLADALRPIAIPGTAASKLADRTFMMTQGTLLDCNLDVAISSAVPGMVKCTLTRSVFGDDRKVVLLERGTELTGQYQGALQQGQNRLFILWARAKTPAGVLINLASPGTDSLGRSGVDGFIDTHFWERFGAALFLSVIDDGLSILAAQAQNSNSGGSTIVLPQNSQTAAKNAASVAVENSIRIPPTLNKNQGEHVSIFVARDLDFRTVYAVKAADLSY